MHELEFKKSWDAVEERMERKNGDLERPLRAVIGELRREGFD